MADDGDQQQQLLLSKVHGLGDLDLAALLSLIAREHCIVATETGPALDTLVEEFRLVARRTFGLDAAVVDCSPHTTLDDLAAAILVHHHHNPHDYHRHNRHPSIPQTPNPRPATSTPLVSRTDSYSYFNHSPRQGGGGGGGGGYASQQMLQPSPLRNLSPRPTTSSTTPTANASPALGYSSYGADRGGRKTPTLPPSSSPPRRIANVIVAKNLDAAPKAVQIQCLELLRTRRLFTRTSVQTAPKQFLFVAVVGTDSSSSSSSNDGGVNSGPNGVAARLTPHLNDFFYIAHWHDPADGFAHLEEREEERENSGDGHGDDDHTKSGARGSHGSEGDEDPDTPTSFESAESVVRHSVTGTPRGSGINALTPAVPTKKGRNLTSWDRDTANDTGNHDNNDNADDAADDDQKEPLFSESDIATLALAACEVAVDVDVLRYAMNVVSFLRLHRAVSVSGAGLGTGGPGVTGSVTPTSTRHLEHLIRGLAALHGLDYAPPALVGLAARKVYLHRVRVIAALGPEGPDSSGEFPVERERSMQWGSDRAAVEALLAGVGPTEVLDDVLGMVDAPL